ncbi:YciI family protein [Chitinimonas koreensis]|uniref:YciI family protein n=1 Tax=Chitinimonas koreensis TaxID=356302 RepID=UPI000411FD31|nr:YciI family protein [Chitinimonas koreensis]QNM98031.1 hypothetical protein H9L41_07165 [Chitinimonas koreensis]
MLFVVTFDDRPDAAAVRQREMAAHLDYLRLHGDRIKVAGSLRESPECTPVGACWIVEAADADTVHALVQADPFHRHGLRAGYRVLHWSKAFDAPAVV